MPTGQGQPETASSLPGWETARDRSSLTLWKETDPADTLNLGFWSPGLGSDPFLLFLPTAPTLLWQSR